MHQASGIFLFELSFVFLLLRRYPQVLYVTFDVKVRHVLYSVLGGIVFHANFSQGASEQFQ